MRAPCVASRSLSAGVKLSGRGALRRRALQTQGPPRVPMQRSFGLALYYMLVWSALAAVASPIAPPTHAIPVTAAFSPRIAEACSTRIREGMSTMCCLSNWCTQPCLAAACRRVRSPYFLLTSRSSQLQRILVGGTSLRMFEISQPLTRCRALWSPS